MNNLQTQNDQTIFRVILNHEEQYSIWPERREIPAGWRYAGFSGNKTECLSHIKEVWKDMRPLSLRNARAAQVKATS